MRDLYLPPDVQADIELAVHTLLGRFGQNISKIILFGSYANDKYQPDSDIDLAVVLCNLPDARDRRGYKETVELDHREVDLLFCSQEQLASNRFVYRWINEEGVTLYEKL